MFYNTNKTEDLAKANADTQKQDEIILALFKKHFALSPWQASDLSGIFITSVRRSISNLTTEGLIRKSNDMTMGKLGKREHVWTIETNRLTVYPESYDNVF